LGPFTREIPCGPGSVGGCQANNDGDPIVQYDKIADRWIFMQFFCDRSVSLYRVHGRVHHAGSHGQLLSL